MRIFLSGPMGTGKSTVAIEVARLCGAPVLDLDSLIENAERRSVTQLFAERGERAFRDLEAIHVRRVIAEHDRCVVALGGGTVTRDSTRRLLLGNGTLVTLVVPAAELARRLANAEDRPLLVGGDREQIIATLLAERRGAYAESHAAIDATAPPAEVAQRVLAAVEQDAVVVALGERTYPVLIGRNVRDSVASRLRQSARPPSKVILVTDTVVGVLHAQPVATALSAVGVPVVTVELPPGEAAKHIGSVQLIWDAALKAGVDRDACVVGVGGGVVGDLAGFAAATILRGIGLVHVPTTLLAMVDSAVGGKTGFDTPEGKNLIGAFHQPRFVVSDIEVLSTLPIEERRAGLAEVVKSAWLDCEASVAQLERDAALLLRGDPDATLRAVRMAVRLKARVVSGDEREGGERALLNLGHTVGHAIEAAAGYQGMRHGEAVSLGLVAAFRLARSLGQPDLHLERVTQLLHALGLPTDVDRHLSERTLSFIASDKKRGSGKLKFVVPGVPGATGLVSLALDDIGRRVAGGLSVEKL
jgi:3-dehydroquinate synthase